jgi:metal-responsive CopG/Arc/MetJ family transcriptional regulator
MGMRLHITMDDRLIAELDQRVGPRRRSAFIARATERALDDERRWELIESSLGSIEDAEHEWSDDAAGWVRAQRRADSRRLG